MDSSIEKLRNIQQISKTFHFSFPLLKSQLNIAIYMLENCLEMDDWYQAFAEEIYVLLDMSARQFFAHANMKNPNIVKQHHRLKQGMSLTMQLLSRAQGNHAIIVDQICSILLNYFMTFHDVILNLRMKSKNFEENKRATFQFFDNFRPNLGFPE